MCAVLLADDDVGTVYSKLKKSHVPRIPRVAIS